MSDGICIHCVLSAALDEHFEQMDGSADIDVVESIAGCVHLLADLLMMLPMAERNAAGVAAQRCFSDAYRARLRREASDASARPAMLN